MEGEIKFRQNKIKNNIKIVFQFQGRVIMAFNE